MRKNRAKIILSLIVLAGTSTAFGGIIYNQAKSAAIISVDGRLAVIRLPGHTQLNEPISCGMLGEHGFSKSGTLAYFRDATDDHILVVNIETGANIKESGVWLEFSPDERVACVSQQSDDHKPTQNLFDTVTGRKIGSVCGCHVIVCPYQPTMLVFGSYDSDCNPTLVNMATAQTICQLTGKPLTFPDTTSVATQFVDSYGTFFTAVYNVSSGAITKHLVGRATENAPGLPVVERQSKI